MPSDSKSTKPVSAPAPIKAKKVNAKVEEPVSAPAPVVVAEAPAPKQKGGKVAASAPVSAPAPVVAEAIAPVPAPKKAGKKVAAAPAPVAEAPVPKQKGGKKVVAVGDKKPKQTKSKKVETEVDAEADADEKGVRSFKVKLPGSEEFAGRFTGLTPYQAANKALSKYFRENKTVKNEINFSIVESTRGSKRSTYVYNGKREKLETPVKYSIKGTDGEQREIVKEYKNKLTKVKKAIAKSEAKTETA